MAESADWESRLTIEEFLAWLDSSSESTESLRRQARYFDDHGDPADAWEASVQYAARSLRERMGMPDRSAL